jgi:hypothetical protein
MPYNQHVLWTPKPDAPSWPFPTAFPGLGARATSPVFGQHASNPTSLRYNTIHPRTAVPHNKPHKPIWFYWQSYSVINPISPLQQAKQIQAYWAKLWKNTLTPLQRSAWATLASTYPVPNLYGQTRNLSGWGMFLHCNWLACIRAGWPPYASTASINTSYLTPPTTWPALPAPTVTTPNIYYTFPLYTPPQPNRLYLEIDWTWTGPPTFAEIAIFLSNPGQYVDARKQGELFPAGFYRIFPATDAQTWFFLSMCRNDTTAGRTITVAHKMHLYPAGGESPLQYTQLTIQPWPPPPPPDDDG